MKTPLPVRSIFVTDETKYDIVSGASFFDINNPTLSSIGAGQGSRRFVVLDKNIKNFQPEIASYFNHFGIETRIELFEPGEENKSLSSMTSLLEKLDTFPIRRRDEPVIAIGGGVLTDVVAFVASVYRRGVPHIKIPTTLMGYVDAAIGIKCGINFNGNKNRIGAFEPPLSVLLDRSFLKTLPHRHIMNGLGEIIKLAVILDAELFEWLEKDGISCVNNNFQSAAGDAILERSIDLMINELAPNLHENNLARTVDFGHTFSLAYEMAPGHDVLHGEAVLMDIILSVFLANVRGSLSEGNVSRILTLIAGLPYHLPSIQEVTPAVLWHSIIERACHRNGLQRIPLPSGIGQCIFANDITPDELNKAHLCFKKWMYRYENTYERRCVGTG
ncbi:MAG: sedoheptulose 7-phosphate cyclase [Alphaproteobacteria bacterium]|nr:sedoheptulose 7-phosphate cyclase [Alphaproteobacteria bacterium]OJV45560.1 MAG: hypothetical protein BGO28_03515 [Alphaproteobacteria bacterium 43-37]